MVKGLIVSGGLLCMMGDGYTDENPHRFMLNNSRRRHKTGDDDTDR